MTKVPRFCSFFDLAPESPLFLMTFFQAHRWASLIPGFPMLPPLPPTAHPPLSTEVLRVFYPQKLARSVVLGMPEWVGKSPWGISSSCSLEILQFSHFS